MNRQEAKKIIAETVEESEALLLAIKSLDAMDKIQEIVDCQLIAGKNNYKEIYSCFMEIVTVVQDNY